MISLRSWPNFAAAEAISVPIRSPERAALASFGRHFEEEGRSTYPKELRRHIRRGGKGVYQPITEIAIVWRNAFYVRDRVAKDRLRR